MTASSCFSPAGRIVSTSCKVAAGVSVVMAVFSSNAALFMEDAITNAAPGSNLGSTAPWGNSSGQIKVAAGSLTFTGLQSPTNTGNLANILGTAGGSSYRAFTGTAATNGAVYYSFLIQSSGAPGAANSYLTGLLPSGTTSPSGSTDPLAVYYAVSANGYQLGIRKNGTSTTNAPDILVTNVTQLVVVKYAFGAGAGDDTVSLFLNPTPGAGEPTPDASQTGGTDAASLQNIYLKSSGSYGSWNFDTLRVGTAWSDIAPGNGSPPPSYVPFITVARLAPQGMVLRGTNGTPAANYQVITSTNLTLAASNWPAVGNYSFDGVGNFDSTNPVQAGAGRQFFRLLTGATNPPASAAPGITNQPQSLTVAVGGNVNFSVGANGTSPLNYFWSFNTNTPVGGNSNTLALLNVTTNDAGGYRVVVSNSVGTATSSVATLTVLIPPSITTQPTNFTVTAGGSAAFSVTAAGSATLRYQWFFNTNTALANATNATFTLNPVNATNAGTYSVIVTNSVGSVTSSVALLTVFSPPVITVQPQSQSVTVSNDATFSVTAAGTAPLAYRWFFNTNTLVGGNSNSYTRVNVQTTNAGTYSVIITNNYGAVTSAFATLTVNPASATPDFSLVGFAALDGFSSNATLQVGGTTGGAGGALVLVSNLTDLVKYLQTNTTLRVQIQNDITLSNLANHHFGFPAGYLTGEILVNSNKTIFSTNGAIISRGTLRIGKASNGKQNIIIRNLKFRDLWVYDPSGNYDTYGWDYIGLEGGSHHVWVDHCDFEQAYDGMLDIVHASDYVTASWNIFRTQKKCSLVGHTDSNAAEDTGHLNVTFHHNYYVDVEERMPRMRFGNAHVFNLYCENLGGNGIQSTADAATLVENSFFWHPASGSLPTREENGGPTGIVKVVSCVISNLPGVNVQFRQFGQTNFLFNAPFVGATPPYSYTNVMHPVGSTANIVTNWAGTGKLTSF